MSAVNSDLAINNANYSTPLREDIIQTAVKFLQNPNVINTPLAQKQKFLQRKGLTDQEVQAACERSGAYVHHESQLREPVPAPPPYKLQAVQTYSVFERIRDIVQNLAVFGAVAYAIYAFYKKFISPYLFGRKKSVEESVDDLSKTLQTSVQELKDNLSSVKVEVDKISQGTGSNTQRQLQDLKSEISTVKGLLLSRKQFPSVSNTPVVPPSIPAWQLSSVQSEPDTDLNKPEDLLEEFGSGSGSSEPEHTTKNSDSSLELV